MSNRKQSITKRYCGGYLLNHASGHVMIEKSGSDWTVRELCTGEVFATTKTKKDAVRWVLYTFGLKEEE